MILLRWDSLGLGSVLGGDGQILSGIVGLSEEVEVELVLPGGEAFLAAGCCCPLRFCCMRQWILNQFDLRP